MTLALAACSDVEVKPQDPTELNRFLRKERKEVYRERTSALTLLPENDVITLPETSLPSGAMKFKAKALGDTDAAIDPASVSLGGDGVTRYTLVVRTVRGVVNVSHEGMRCPTAEWKMYATGRPDGSWARVPMPRWRKVDLNGTNDVRRILAEDVMCDKDGAPPKDVATVIARVRKSNVVVPVRGPMLPTYSDK